MTVRPHPISRIGIVGGGQLARMLVRAASRLGCETVVLDPYPQSPAGHVASRQEVGSFDDPEALRRLVEACDVTTYDLEGINAQALMALAEEGHTIHPAPSLLYTLQDKLEQKLALENAGVPVAPYEAIAANTPEVFSAFGYPLVQKARRGGYDGRGVAVLKSADDFENHLPVPAYLERFIVTEKELAVMVARNTAGEVKVFPAVEMVFREGANVLELLLAPARIPDGLAHNAQELAARAVTALEGVGVFGVELFLPKDGGELMINEVSPRTHNSGHYTIEACLTDQFEQHLRAILGLPLGATNQLKPAAMVNLLGSGKESGPCAVEGLEEAMAMEGVSVHLYGKAESRPGRKMGHVTILGESLEDAEEKARRVAEKLKVFGLGPEQNGQHKEASHG
jgi:5-(carboxyamino)imidazole ribonucleotide synthase